MFSSFFYSSSTNGQTKDVAASNIATQFSKSISEKCKKDASLFKKNSSITADVLSAISTTSKMVGADYVSLLSNLSPYVVDALGNGTFLTVQAAYEQAVLDGRGGASGIPAVILILPGVYDFGSTLFTISVGGIHFLAVTDAGISDAVVFSASGTGGGIQVDTGSSVPGTDFAGITFGKPGDGTNGFLLEHVSSSTIYYSKCGSTSSNIRVVNSGSATYTALFDDCIFSFFSVASGVDIFTSANPNAVLAIKDSIIQDTAVSGAGGSIINVTGGAVQINLNNVSVTFANFTNFFAATGTAPVTLLASYTRVEYVGFTSAVFVNWTAPLAAYVDHLFLLGQFVGFFQSGTVPVGQISVITAVNSYLITPLGGLVLDGPVIGHVFLTSQANNWLAASSPLLINGIASSAGDVITAIISNTLVQTSGTSGSAYADLAGSGTGTILVGSSNSINGANTVTGGLVAAALASL